MFGGICLDPNTEIRLGYLPTSLVETQVEEVSDGFRSKKEGGGRFYVPGSVEDSAGGERYRVSPRAVVIGLDTRTTVVAGEEMDVHRLDGKLVAGTAESDNQTTLSSNESMATRAGSVVTIDPPEEPWLWAEDDEMASSGVFARLKSPI